ncbi:hypothetical protein [Conexibacter sp. SYSU D00693]|uniref:hypothetical protein n=1 Tax=Conexibacter sp. SYSU D00693 TaxID=2812560 RepID=UPI00196A30FA|nr:hypothetical protein [Conexibacter sp. SYSU D00693]
MTATASAERQSLTLRIVRTWLPVVVVAAGIAVMAFRGFDDVGLEGGAGIIGAGLSVWLLNQLHRIGVDGDAERYEEDAARDFFDRHGRWPDEPQAARG